MLMNADFSQPVWRDGAQAAWLDSPQPGVQRIPLERIGAEVARATTLVRFAPGSHFPSHVHGGGEEILVLEGVFSDETGDYPAGSYLRNPPGSQHRPHSVPGCTLLVKLWQFAPDDQAHVRLDTGQQPWQRLSTGLQWMALHQHGAEEAALCRSPAGLVWADTYPGGLELLVLEGCLSDGVRPYSSGCWLRLPRASQVQWQALEDTQVWLKKGHLGSIVCWDQRVSG